MTTTAAKVLPSQRAHFDLPDGVTFLNCANMSPQLQTVTAVGVEAVRRKSEPWQTEALDWFTGAEALRSAAARLMGADPGALALVPAVSYGIALAAANIPVQRGQNIVILDEQFPSNVYAWRELADRLTRAGAEDFAGLVDYTPDYRPGARRFDMGGYPQFVLAPMAHTALLQLLGWGVENVQATLSRLTGLIAEEVEALGLTALPADQRVGHMIGVRFPGGVPATLPERLTQERVYVSVRGDAVRIAPHVYNDEADVDRLLSVLQEVA